MRSKNRTIHVDRQLWCGERPVPPFIDMIHRHFEKAPPLSAIGAKSASLTGPVDLLRTLGVPDALVNEIDSIELIYLKGGSK